MILLRNLAFYLAFYSGSAAITLGAFIVLPFDIKLFRKLVHAWSRFHRFCVTRLLGCELVLEGSPGQGPVLYAIRHESFFEAIDAPHLFSLPGVFAKAELMTIPFWGRVGRAYGLVPVARGEGAKALMTMIRAARELVAQGRPLVIFPEGTRVPHGERRSLQSGFAGLYKMLALPVVPVAVNSGPLYHRGLKRAGQITYRFGETIPPGLPREEVEARVLEAINALNN